MAVYENGKALPGTERKKVDEQVLRRRRINRAMWRAETRAKGPKAGVYSPRLRKSGDLA